MEINKKWLVAEHVVVGGVTHCEEKGARGLDFADPLVIVNTRGAGSPN